MSPAGLPRRGSSYLSANLDANLTVPVFSGDRIVAVAGVANKEGAYDPSDVRQLTLLLDSAWKIVERRWGPCAAAGGALQT